MTLSNPLASGTLDEVLELCPRRLYRPEWPCLQYETQRRTKESQ